MTDPDPPEAPDEDAQDVEDALTALEEHHRSGLPTSSLEDVAKELGIDL